MKKFTGFSAAAAVLASSIAMTAVPAEARHHRYRHHDRVDAGDVVTGIFILGAIAAIAGSGSKSKRNRQRDNDYRYDPPYQNERSNDPQYRPDDNQPWSASPQSGSATRDGDTRAVDACSWAAEGEAGSGARVSRVDAVSPESDGLRVTGVLSERGRSERSFACSYRAGRVTWVGIN